MIKICLVVPTLKKGGMERVVTELANSLVKSGYSVDIICLLPKSEIEYTLSSLVRVHFPTYIYNKNIIFKFKCLYYIYKQIKLLKPNSVLAFSEVFNPISIIAGKLARTKVYISDRSSPILKHGFSVDFLRRVIYPYCDGIVAQTTMSRDIMRSKKFNDNIKVIANPVRKINDDYEKMYGKVIISVGRLVKSKNFDFMIKVFSKIKTDWQLMILGDGPEYNKLNSLIEELGIQNRVKLVGKVDDVDFYFSKSSIFAFTSLSEGFPNAVNEAMCYPLATIALDCVAGPSDMIDNNVNGYLIPLNDTILFENKLVELINDIELRNKFISNSINNRDIYSGLKFTENITKFIL